MKKHDLFLTRIWLWLVLIALLAACGGGEEPAVPTEAAEAAAEVQTVVVVATPTPEPAAEESAAESSEPAPETDSSSEETAVSEDAPTLEAEAVEAGAPTVTTLVDLNVRTGPGTNYPVVGALSAGSTAQIVGRSPSGNWWKIQCPPGAGSECWLSAGNQYSTAENAAGVPVAAVPPAPATHTPSATPLAETTPTSTATTDPDATATATATATEEGAPTATSTSTATATATTTTEQPTATYTPTATATEEQQAQVAPFDNDSVNNPAVSNFLSITGVRDFTYSDAVSYEEGDQEDWIEFEFPNNSNTNQVVWITLDCTITGDPGAQLVARIYEDQVGTTEQAFCNDGETQFTVDNTKVQQVRIFFNITAENIYAEYTITVVGFK